MSFFKKIFGSKKEGKSLDPEKKGDDLLTEKYFRNLDMFLDYELTIDCYCDVFDTWNEVPFGSDVSFSVVNRTVKHILENEFSEDITERIKNGNVNEIEMNEMITKLDADFALYQPQLEYTKTKEDNSLDRFQKGVLK